MITYSKLKSGAWGLRGPVEELVPGKKILVTTKKGEKKEEVVGRIIWTGDGVALATVVQSGTGDRAASLKQLQALGKMLGRLAKVQQFDSMQGNGEEAAQTVREQVEEAGGWEELTSKRASELIDWVSQLIDDEM